MIPNSICFISTYNSCHELIGMLLSLSLHHKSINAYGFVDDKTYDAIVNLIPKLPIKFDFK